LGVTKDPSQDGEAVIEEQCFLDVAWKAVERELDGLSGPLPDATADAHAAESLKALSEKRLKTLLRLGDNFIAGSYLVDDGQDFLDEELDGNRNAHVGSLHLVTELGTVIDWRSPLGAALQFGEEFPGLTVIRRRTIRTKGRVVTEVQSEWLSAESDPGSAEFGRVVASGADHGGEEGQTPKVASASSPGDLRGGDILIAELEASRDGRMRQAVATIQKDQNEAIRAARDQVFIIEGGPGTGKTLVGLHRMAKILYDLALSSDESPMLVVGPNPRFVNYISDVLPSLGEHDTTTLDIALLCLQSVKKKERPSPSSIAREDDVIAKVKGDLGMAVLLRLAAWSRVEVRELKLRVNGRLVVFHKDEVSEILMRARQAFMFDEISYAASRDSVARQLNNEALSRARAAAERLAGSADERRDRRGGRSKLGKTDTDATSQPQVEAPVGSSDEGLTSRGKATPSVLVVGTGKGEMTFEAVTRTFMPDIEPLALVTALLTSDATAKAIAIDSPVAAMVVRNVLLRSSASPWTTADLPLIDESAHLLGLNFRQYRHVVVDEAQDLSAMAWRAIGRRTMNQSLTILGDLNQSTDPAAVGEWQDALDVLGIGTADTLTLGVSYRLPKPILKYAVQALPKVDQRRIPSGLRDGEAPEVTELSRPIGADDLTALLETIGNGHYVGVITTDAKLSRIATSRTGTLVLTPDEAKGLEFDVAIVVEPGHWCDESEVDYRRLFIALSRPTRRLIVLHHDPLPRRLVSPAGRH